MLLDQEVPITPLSISRTKQAVGTTTTLVGYGKTSPSSSWGTLHYGNTTIATLPSDGLIETGLGEAALCPGDSGGPWLVGGEVAGISSRGWCDPALLSIASSMNKWGLWVEMAAARLQDSAVNLPENDDQFSWFNDADAPEVFAPTLTVDNLLVESRRPGDFNGDDCDDELIWSRAAYGQPDEVLVTYGCGKGSTSFKVSKGMRMIHIFDADGTAGDDVMIQMPNRIVVLVRKSNGQYEWASNIPASYRIALADVNGQGGQEILLVDKSRIDLLDWSSKQHTISYISVPSAAVYVNGTYDVDGKSGKELVLTVMGGLRIVSFPGLEANAREIAFPGTSFTINAHDDLDGDGDDEIIVVQQGVVRIVDATTVTGFSMPTNHYIVYGIGPVDAVPGDEVILRTGAGIRVLNYKQGSLTASSVVQASALVRRAIIAR
jgi:hypothetical protein